MMPNNTFTNNTFTNSSDTVTITMFKEYLNDPMVVFLVIITWSLMMTNHKYRQTLDTFKAFKKQSADEIFSLQQSLSQYMYDTSLPVTHYTLHQESQCPTNTTTMWENYLSMYNAQGSENSAPRVHHRTEYDTSVPFTVILKAVKNYCDFHKIPMLNVSLDDVSRSSAGIKGWSKMCKTTTKKTTPKKITPKQPTDYNLFVKKSIADIKRDNPGIAHKMAFIQATKMWQSKKE